MIAALLGVARGLADRLAAPEPARLARLLRAAAGDRLERIDRPLGVPRVRTVRGLELALLQPAVGPPAARDLAAWRTGLADRSAARVGPTGADPAGRPTRPAPVATLLRAAVAETEVGGPDQHGPVGPTGGSSW